MTHSEHSRKWRLANLERCAARQREWNAKHRERSREIARKAYRKNREKKLIASRLRYKLLDESRRRALGIIPRDEWLKIVTKPEHIKRATRQRNSKLWRHRNRERIRVYEMKRRHTDPQALLKNRFSSRLHHALKSQQVSKTSKTVDMIGCSFSALRRHIESQFIPGMTWENRELWNIDHIRPCASFDLRDPEQVKQCFHFSNLQPLWSLDNRKKWSKYEGTCHYTARNTRKNQSYQMSLL